MAKIKMQTGATMVVTEVDGGIHELTSDRDRARDKLLSSHGIRTIHIGSQFILDDIDTAVGWLRNAIFKFDHSNWHPRKKRTSGSLSRISLDLPLMQGLNDAKDPSD